jgi:hypothetical protein
MNTLNRAKGGCKICRLKNVQVQKIEPGLGQNSSKLALRIASKHNVGSLGQFLSKCSGQCPSPNPKCPSPNPADTVKRYLNLEGYVMAANVELVWLPLARIAILQGKSVKTIRRMIEDGSLVAVKRTVKGGRSHTNKSFVLADQDTINLDKQLCRKQGVVPEHLGLELMTIDTDEYVSLFIVSYNKEKAAGYGQD